MPKPGATVKEGTKVLLYLEPGEEENDSQTQEQDNGDMDDTVIVPDVLGKSLIETNKILTSMGLKLKVEGSGIATSQSPEAGAEISHGSEVLVIFETE